jgi:hypothetical protein
MKLISELLEGDRCPCCGNTTQRVSGRLEEDDGIVCMYLISWTGAKLKHPADILLAAVADGDLHGHAGPVCAVLKYDFPSNAFMVCDHADHPLGHPAADLGQPVDRDMVVGKSLAGLIFGRLDHIWVNDTVFRGCFR